VEEKVSQRLHQYSRGFGNGCLWNHMKTTNASKSLPSISLDNGGEKERKKRGGMTHALEHLLCEACFASMQP
jgi:hypothetical protein